MEHITPQVDDPHEVVYCNPNEFKANLFKDHQIDGERLRTYLRIRPSDQQYDVCFKLKSPTDIIAIPPESSVTYKNESREEKKPRVFTFTKIFKSDSDQVTIYNTCALPLVQRFLNGDNCLLFVYGITSSGKSFTMLGNVTNPGIVPRSLKTCFDIIGDKIIDQPVYKPINFSEVVRLTPHEIQYEKCISQFVIDSGNEIADKNNEKKFISSILSLLSDSSINNTINNNNNTSINDSIEHIKYEMWITFVEFYNENIIDLLAVDVESEKQPKLAVFQDLNNNYFIKGLRNIQVKSLEDAYKVFLYGKENLHISSTLLNNNSSRSHCSFNIKLIKIDQSNNQVIHVNTISFCDLAGSERSNKTNSVGDRLKEAGKINASLLSLSQCISAIRHNQKYKNKQKRIPFRDSKLTKVFQPFLSGTGIANMIVNINPSSLLFDETLVSLNFSAIASQVVVSDEEQRKNFYDSLKRLTQLWMQSTQRWSSFSAVNKPIKPSFPNSVSIIKSPLNEEDEDIDEDEVIDEELVNNENEITFREKIDEIQKMNFDSIDAQEMENLKNQVEYLSAQLEQAKNKEIEFEIEVRKEVTREFMKLKKNLEVNHENKEKRFLIKKEEYENEIKKLKQEKKEEKAKFDKKIYEVEAELFKEREINIEKECKYKEEIENLKRKIEELKKIEELRKIEELNKKAIESSLSLTQSMKVESLDKSINTEMNLVDNSSQVEIINLEKETSTDAIILENKLVQCDVIDQPDKNFTDKEIQCAFKQSVHDQEVQCTEEEAEEKRKTAKISELLIIPKAFSVKETQTDTSNEKTSTSEREFHDNTIVEDLKQKLSEREKIVENYKKKLEMKDQQLKEKTSELEIYKRLPNIKSSTMSQMSQSSQSSQMSQLSHSSQCSQIPEDSTLTNLSEKEAKGKKKKRLGSAVKNPGNPYISHLTQNESKKIKIESNEEDKEQNLTNDELGNFFASEVKKTRKRHKRDSQENERDNDESLLDKPTRSKKKQLHYEAFSHSISPIVEDRSEKTKRMVTRSRARKVLTYD